jgi:hypothetical protein
LRPKGNRSDLVTFRTASSTATSLLFLLEGLKIEENLWTHILTDSLDAPVRDSRSERSLKLRLAAKRTTEKELLERRVPVGSK